MSNPNRYHELFLAAVAANPDKSKKAIQQDTTVIWNDIKAGRKEYESEIYQLKARATRATLGLLNFWARKPKNKTTDSSEARAATAVSADATVDADAHQTPADERPTDVRTENPQINFNSENSSTAKRTRRALNHRETDLRPTYCQAHCWSE